MKQRRVRRAATAMLGAVAGTFGASDAARGQEPGADPQSPSARDLGQDPPPPAAPAKPPPAREVAPPPATVRSTSRPVPPQPARVRAVRATRADDRRDH